MTRYGSKHGGADALISQGKATLVKYCHSLAPRASHAHCDVNGSFRIASWLDREAGSFDENRHLYPTLMSSFVVLLPCELEPRGPRLAWCARTRLKMSWCVKYLPLFNTLGVAAWKTSDGCRYKGGEEALSKDVPLHCVDLPLKYLHAAHRPRVPLRLLDRLVAVYQTALCKTHALSCRHGRPAPSLLDPLFPRPSWPLNASSESMLRHPGQVTAAQTRRLC